MNFLVMPLFFLSGALFPMEGLPSALTIITRIDPLSYGVDALHGTLSGVSSFGVSLDILMLFVLVAVITWIGAWQFSKIEI